MELPQDEGFAVCVVGDEVRWHDREHLLDDTLTDGPLPLFDIKADPDCTTDIWQQNQAIGEDLKTKTRSYISLSQTLMYDNRVTP